MKNLLEYEKCLSHLTVKGIIRGNPPISGITNNSRNVKPSFIFCAIPGAKSNGHKYIPEAIASGASLIIHSEELEKYEENTSYIMVSDPYFAYAIVSECYFDFPSKDFNLIGITGTNGKTTTAFLIRNILTENASRCGLISTVQYSFGDTLIDASRTTPEAYELQGLFHDMKNNRCDHVVMEVSSHGLDQHRPGTARFAAAVFSNLTGDHLDYHKNMENYFQAKRKLFSEYLSGNGSAIINIDDPYGKRLADEFAGRNLISYGKDENALCSIKINDISSTGMEIDFILAGKTLSVKTNLTGEHNASNMAAAISSAYALGAGPEKIKTAMEKNLSVPGRLEQFISPAGTVFYVDYAHTDDALLRVLSTLRNLCKGRLIALFGCGGDRDRTKRPRMGSVASKFADAIILTNDNPRTEDPLLIIEEIKKGIPDTSETYSLPDRREAIAKAVSMAKPSDIVLLAGKGHEAYQEFNGRTESFDDRAELQKALARL
ncbi:MAG: UDP-N-acetylmuramoyl-L-alanyl-D-glutamate--2,6-diaminopimelate ligase [Lentisphaerae bacterium GWF2_44_16]|nr:MAG: UDP-N-acetylmuramoyl-L-alanyl-D-glutamate--2,6-diaminopimelate ligase [Lentisphaerae bacterium GWF2_44_16]